jgi:SAM-dependent methyltransferase
MIDKQWYRKIWSLDIKNESWVENTVNQVDFLIEAMELSGRERILDLACGYGRHALEFARRGYEVTGVDITPAFVEDAKMTARNEGLEADFILSDLRDVGFNQEFDVVLNLADGAIGYLEDDQENLKIFDRISTALKPGGKHLMDICNAEHAERFFPKKWWEIGEKSVSLPEFDWDPVTRRMLFSSWDIKFGEVAQKPMLRDEDRTTTRLYSLPEVEKLLQARDMRVIKSFGDYNVNVPSDEKHLQLLVYSRKNF